MANLVLKTNTTGNDVSLELVRGSSYVDWRIINTSGNLHMQANWSTKKVDYYDVLKLDYNSGNAWLKGNTSVDSLTIRKNDLGAHIAFSRGDFNYITTPANGVVAFVMNGQDCSATTPSLIITEGSLYPGTVNAVALGTATKNWSNTHTRKVTSSSTLTITPGSTLYLDSGTDTSILFRQGGTEAARFNTDGNLQIKNKIVPSSNNTSDIGTSTLRWKNIYATDFTGHLAGNADTATLATRVIVTPGTSDIERSIVVDSGSETGQHLYHAADVTVNYAKKTVTAPGGFIGNATTATALATSRQINGTNFNGTSNITTAKWGTARNIYIADAYAANTSDAVSVDGSANATLKLPQNLKIGLLDTNLKSASVMTNGVGTTGYYYNIATATANVQTSNFDTALTLLVTGYYDSTARMDGIVKAHMRWNNGKTTPSTVYLEWLVNSPNINPDDFYFTYKIDGDYNITLNLYVYISGSWKSYCFTKLVEHAWGRNSNRFAWTLRNVEWVSGGSNFLSAIPTDEIQTQSIIRAISNNAASASTIAVTNTTPGSATTYYPLYSTGLTGNQTVRANADFYYYDTGSASYLNVGNSNMGAITLHDGSSHYVNLVPANFAANRTLTIPEVGKDATIFTDAGGTINGMVNITYNSSDTAAATSGSGCFIIGPKTGGHLSMDVNEIQAKADGTTAGTLHLNYDGGPVLIGSGGVTVSGALAVGSTITAEDKITAPSFVGRLGRVRSYSAAADVDAALSSCGAQLEFSTTSAAGTSLNNDGVLLTLGYSTSWGAQIFVDDGSGQPPTMALRSRSASTAWGDWYKVITSGGGTINSGSLTITTGSKLVLPVRAASYTSSTAGEIWIVA